MADPDQHLCNAPGIVTPIGAVIPEPVACLRPKGHRGDHAGDLPPEYGGTGYWANATGDLPALITGCGRDFVAELAAAERRADRLAATVTILHSAGFHADFITPLDHIDGCECEQADACTVEDPDPRCTPGTPYPALVMDDGAYTLAIIDLTELAAGLRAAQADECDDRTTHVLIDAYGDIEPAEPIPSPWPAGSWP